MHAFAIRSLTGLALAMTVLAPALADQAAAYRNLLTPLLQTGTDIVGQPLAYPPGAPKITAAIVTIPPGGETGWHSHEVPLFVQVLEGEITVDYGGEVVNVYGTGEAMMEAMNRPHQGTNKGSVPVRLLAVYMGSADRTDTVKAPASE